MGGVGLAIGSMLAGAGLVILVSALRGERIIPQFPPELPPELFPPEKPPEEKPTRQIEIIISDGGETFITQVDL